MHVGAIAGFFTFSWGAFAVMMVLWWLTGGVGITLGYHRYFTHRSYETPKWFSYVLAVCGCLAGEAGPISWVAAHRYHHTFSDMPEDVHSPYKDPKHPVKSFMWAHFLWLFGRENFLSDYDKYKRYTPDMVRDKVLMFLNDYHIVPTFFLAGLLYWMGGWPYIVWGIFVRSVMVYHATWFVNSAAHVWGYRTFNTTDRSRNNWWVAILAFGEGWHNNHHAFQRSARHGLNWWEFDLTYSMIQVMKLFGLASNIYLPSPASLAARVIPADDPATQTVEAVVEQA
jgi:stearoyl-CoA desaturase (delta-9 desaturase)